MESFGRLAEERDEDDWESDGDDEAGLLPRTLEERKGETAVGISFGHDDEDDTEEEGIVARNEGSVTETANMRHYRDVRAVKND